LSIPKVTIVIPVYNGARYLREAIDSALAQTFKDIEVIVVNDGSSDGGKTEEIALSYGTAIRYFRKENGGVASALNIGIREMKGDYFSWLSHDDVFYVDKIAAQLSFLDSSGSIPDTILYGDYDIINSKSEFTGSIKIDAPKPERMCFALMVSYPIHGCTTLIPRSCFEKEGLFDEKLRTTQDYDLWFRFAGLFPFVHQAKSLIKSRHHEAQGTITMNKLHMLEVDKLLSIFVNEISPEELVGGYGGTLPHAYAYVAESFYGRKCLGAANQARKRAFQSLEVLTLTMKWKLFFRLSLMEVKGRLCALLGSNNSVRG